MENKLLTIAIPTFNRPENLRQILNVLQGEDSNQFNVLISDDSTNSDVESIAFEFRSKLPNLRYIKNSKNLGFSLNVAQLYQKSETRYVWFLCDDDIVKEGSVNTIIQTLKLHEPVVAIYNCTWIDSFGRKKVAGVKKDRIFSDLDDFNNYDVLMRLTFLSIIVLERRESIDSIMKNPECKDNVFIQLTICMFLLGGRFKLCEISQDILHRNVGYKYGEFFKFILLDVIKAYKIFPNKFNEKKYINEMIKSLPTALMLFLSQKVGLFRYNGQPTIATIKKLVDYYGFYAAPIILARLLCYLIPAFIIKAAFFVELLRLNLSLKIAIEQYKLLVNRTNDDSRSAGFVNYR